MYTTVIHPLRERLHLSLNEYCVLDSIYHLQNKEKYDFWCIASQDTISDALGVSPRTVLRACKTLIDRGYIHYGGFYKGKTKKVRVVENICDLFNHHKELKGIFYKDEASIKVGQTDLGNDTTYDKLSHHLGQVVTSTYDNVSHNRDNNTNKKIYLMCKKDFEEFWKGYPKKVNKKKAEILYLKIAAENQDRIISAVVAQSKSKQWKEGYIPHPTTWLNGERWNDEVYAPKNQPQYRDIPSAF